jgi:hypothetical protein
MRKFLRFIVATIFQFTFISFLLLTTVRLQLLDPKFFITTFRQANIYGQIEKEIQPVLKDKLQEELEKEGANLAPLTPSQRKMLEEEFDEAIELITAEKIQDLIETNTSRFLGFLNGHEKELLLYLPIRKWGFSELILSSIPFSNLSEETDIEVLISSEKERQEVKEKLTEIRNVVKQVKDAWIISGAVMTSLLIVHYFLSKSPGKIKPTAWLITVAGVSTAVYSGLLFVLSREIASRISYWNQPPQIIITSIIPHLISGVIELWLSIAAASIITGALVLHLTSFILKRRARINPPPLASQVPKR